MQDNENQISLTDIQEETPSSESLDAQLNKLAQAISAQEEKDQAEQPEDSIPPSFDPEAELALQIAEDQALELELAQAQDQEVEQNREQEEEQETEFQTELFGLEKEAIFELPIPSAESGEDGETIELEAVPAPELDLEELQSCVEALLFLSDKPLSLKRIQELLGPSYAVEKFQDAFSAMMQRYQSVHHGIELVEVGGGYQFRTKIGRASLAQKLAKVQTQRLSSGAMETLAIIAYKQPVMKEDVDKIRGVDSSYFVRGLMERKLIKISGRSELPGRPILYSTTDEFLQVFGLKDLSSLPPLSELEQMIPTSESQNPENEDPKVREMRRLVNEMKMNKDSILNYDPKEDEKILQEIKDRVKAIPVSSPYLDELKAAEQLAKEQQQQSIEPPQIG